MGLTVLSAGSLYAAWPGITTITIPPPFCIRADYAFALCHAKAQPQADFLLSVEAQEVLEKGGFLPLEKRA
ncbi:hypothetical protein EGK14_02535 [Erwinia sp. 198]|nr:hypothetical protein EGK14_02535 [Erwinia sp. 198]